MEEESGESGGNLDSSHKLQADAKIALNAIVYLQMNDLTTISNINSTNLFRSKQ